jgi:hypothetical protein
MIFIGGSFSPNLLFFGEKNFLRYFCGVTSKKQFKNITCTVKTMQQYSGKRDAFIERRRRRRHDVILISVEP